MVRSEPETGDCGRERDVNKDGGRGWRVVGRGRWGSPQIPRKVEDRDPERKNQKQRNPGRSG